MIKKGNEIERSWFKNIEAKKEIESPSDCIKAVIDPDQLMPDIVRINNSSKEKLSFTLFMTHLPTMILI